MAWGDSKRDLIIAENVAAKREIELLREQILDLKEERKILMQQLKATQEALIAKESPEAYRDMMYARENKDWKEPSTEEVEENRRKQEQANIVSAYINELEHPLFKDAEDMEEILMRITGIPGTESESLHGNSES